VVWAGGVVAGGVAGAVETGGDGAGAGDGVGDVSPGGGVGCWPVDGGTVVGGGAEVGGSVPVDDGCCKGDGGSTVGVTAVGLELTSTVGSTDTPVVVIRPSESEPGRGPVARPAGIAAVRWRCGFRTTTSGVAWKTGAFDDPCKGVITWADVTRFGTPLGPGRSARTATEAPSATTTSGAANFDADQADNRLRRDRDTSLPHHDSRVISPKA
jgi:hypothetical protein